ncbi:MAG: SMP-30/gluconolactonase/LRE family protein [Rhodospirillales bacterium]
MTITCLSDVRARLGESPVWSAAENAVWWIDIYGCKLHRTAAEGGATETWDMPARPGMIAERASGGLIVALPDGIHGFDPASGSLEQLVAIEADKPENRFNDGKCDAAGRLWIGSLNDADSNLGTGCFYRIDPDLTVTLIEDQLDVPNGLAWSPDDRIMYRTDSHAGVVSACDYDVTAGRRSNVRLFYHFDRATTGSVDGAAMDADGGYWTVLFRGGRLIRVAPDGSETVSIALPVTQPTMPCFGGPGMSTAFITTAGDRLSDTGVENQPYAGGLLKLETGVRGHPVHAFGG